MKKKVKGTNNCRIIKPDTGMVIRLNQQKEGQKWNHAKDRKEKKEKGKQIVCHESIQPNRITSP